jgi:hypothetical protein
VAASDSSWITITGGAAGTGNGTVSYSLAENRTGAVRTATIYAARQKYIITQGAGGASAGMQCTVNSAVIPTLRLESLADMAGDLLLQCTGGTPTPSGSPIPKFDFDLTLNANVTSRRTAAGATEGLLILDDPHSSSNPAPYLRPCGSPDGVCSVAAGTAGQPNVFQGQPGAANQIIWKGVPVDPPGPTGSRTIRMTNIRVNPNMLGTAPTQVVANLSTTPVLPLANPQQTIGFTATGLQSFPAAANLSQCVSANAGAVADASQPLGAGGQNGYQFTLKLSEGFATAWREKNVQWHLRVPALQPPSLAAADAAQDVPGANYFSESGLLANGVTPSPLNPPPGFGPFLSANAAFPVTRGLDKAGLSDQGTRLRAGFSNIPAGVKLFVPLTVPLTLDGGAQQTGVAVLVATDSNGAGAYTRLAGNSSGAVPLTIVNGAAAAVYEIVYADPFHIEAVSIPVAAAWVANLSPNQPAAGIISVQSSFAPVSSIGTSADLAVPAPRFAPAFLSRDAFHVVACASPDLTVALNYQGPFRQGDTGRSYTAIVTNVGQGPSAGAVALSNSLPPGLTATAISGSGWTCTLSPLGCSRADSLPAGSSYPPVTLMVNIGPAAPSSVTSTVTVSGGGESNIANNSASVTTPIATVAATLSDNALGFYPVTPCRVADTRAGEGKTGSFGPPLLPAYFNRVFSVTSSNCGVPSTAQAFSLNMTVKPQNGLDWLSAWPAGQPYPGVSTLNAPGGGYLANAAIIPSGINGGISVVGGQPTDLVVDVNGYFAPPSPQELLFYPITPCRVADTRPEQGKTGAFGPPAMRASSTREFPIRSSNCGIPATAQAYAFNITVLPQGPLGFLSIWPAGQPYPGVSTLNSLDGSAIANAALVRAGTDGAVNVLTSDPTDLIIDVNGYFAPPVPGGLHFYALKPCRVVDTRPEQGKTGPYGPPRMNAYSQRDFPIKASPCNVPAEAQAYSLNVTLIPPGPVDFLSIWPGGGYYPGVSTLNSPNGRMIANAAIIPSGNNGVITVVVGKPTDLVIDINGYFAP